MTTSNEAPVRPVGTDRCFSCGRQFVPDVRDAAWLHPYRFSGRVPPLAIVWMVGLGVAAAVAVGVAGYFGGAVTHWIAVEATHLATIIATALSESQLVGDGLALAVGILPIVLVAVAYPFAIGFIAGGAVALGARRGACRRPPLVGPVALLSGVLAYAVLVATAIALGAPLHESSRVLEVVDPPASYALMIVDAWIVLYGARKAAGLLEQTPFCEACGAWYGHPSTTAIPIGASRALVDALAIGSVAPLAGVPVGSFDPARVELRVTHCTCGASDADLVATVHWDALPKGKRGTGAVDRPWFETTIPAGLGEALEAWWTPRPRPEPLPTAA